MVKLDSSKGNIFDFYTVYKKMTHTKSDSFITFSPTCTACDVELFGSVCSSDCDCVAENTQTGTTDCDPVTGLCLCLPGWTGNRCSIDVDECETGAHNCGSNLCHNTQGSFECECEQGLSKGLMAIVLNMSQVLSHP